MPDPTDWRESSLGEQGIAASLGADLDRTIGEEYPNLTSFLIVRHGLLVLEKYYRGHDRTDPFSVRSVTKSVISALIGIALTEGKISGLDMPSLTFFPEIPAAEVDPRKRAVTVEHLLTMTAGFAWGDVPLRRLWSSDDWVGYLLGLPMAHDPGDVFEYNDGVSHLLSAIITRATGMSARDYALARLFGPLGIAAPAWETDPQGINVGGWGLELTAREMAQFGALYLAGGTWAGSQLVPSAYVTVSTTAHSAGGDPEDAAYGYQWWVADEGGYWAFFAAGYGGQYIFVLPELDLVVTITGEHMLRPSETQEHRHLLTLYVLPAILDGKRAG